MIYSAPVRTTTRRTRIRGIRVAVLLVVLGAVAAVLGNQWPASSPSPVASSIDVPRSVHRGAPGGPGGPVLEGARAGEQRGPLGEADGGVPDGTTVFDDEVPGVANLDSDLLGALRQAATDAAGDGVKFYVDSGWRSPAYQEQLLRDAVLRYGSQAEAARWVATPNTSAHVSGEAVDVASGAAAWLFEHGAAYGLCRVYRNEPWHYELRPDAIARGCPAVYADPTHDPRMQR